MRKIILFLLMTVASYGQADFPEGVQISGGQPTDATSTYVTTTRPDGIQAKILPENISMNVIPPTIHYAPTAANLQGHFKGIDNALGNIVSTTAGVTTRIYFTGDPTTIGAGTLYLTNTANKGTVASAIQSVVNNDNEKKYFTQDLIGNAFAALTNFPPGVYGGALSASTSPNSAQQRYTVELYKCNNAGTPIASGVSGAPVGSLGVTVITILDSGLLTLADASVTGVTVSGNLASQLTLNVGERVRYHVSAEKVGTAAANITQSVYYGNSYNSFLDVPVTFNSSSVTNSSTVTGATVTEAIDNLNAGKVNLAGVPETITSPKTFSPNVSAISGIARGMFLSSNETATANNDVLVGLDINPIFNSGAFTGVTSAPLRVSTRGSLGQINLGGTNNAGFITLNRGTDGVNTGYVGFLTGNTTGDLIVASNGGLGTIAFLTNSNIRQAQFHNSGDLTLQNGGTFTDAGYRLDVQGTTRLNGTVTHGSVPTTSLSTYDILTRNISTGVVEKIPSTSFPVGTGTTNFIPKWTGVNTQANSQLFDNGARVGIGTTSPDSNLHVLGANDLSGTTRNLKAHIGGAAFWDTGSYEELGLGFSGIRSIAEGVSGNWSLAFATGSGTQFNAGTQSERMRVTGDGNVLIGTSTSNGNKLRVVGGDTELDRLSYTKGIPVVSIDFDNIINAGFYSGNNLTNSPEGNTGYFHITVEAIDNLYVHQTATMMGIANTQNRVFTRCKTGSGTWQPWEELRKTTYKVYTALLTQSGTSAPVATVLENTTGATWTWTRGGVGSYTATASSSVLTASKTVVSMTKDFSNVFLLMGSRASSTTCEIRSATSTTATYSDGAMFESFVEFRIYN